MNARAIPRAAIGGYLRLVRLPFDAAIGLLPGNGAGAAPSARLALDRADASVRAIAATVLNDSVLREDARRRRAAAEERDLALRLRSKAQQKVESADSRLEERRDQTDRVREQAEQRAHARREEAEREREKKVHRAAGAERDRLAASRRAAARAEQAVTERAPKARLDAVKTKADALREKEKALTARDEARRLREAAGRAKAERKNGDR